MVCSKSSAAVKSPSWGGELGGLVDANERNDINMENERTQAGPRPYDPVPSHRRVPLAEVGVVSVVVKKPSLLVPG